jgi:hypothetical protein
MTAPAAAGPLATWLIAIGLAKYEALFRKHAIDFELLPELDDGISKRSESRSVIGSAFSRP